MKEMLDLTSYTEPTDAFRKRLVDGEGSERGHNC